VSRTRGWTIGLAVLALAAAALTAVVFASARSLVMIENRSGGTLTLSVETTRPGQFSWQGDLPAGGRVVRTARFSDNSFVVVCRDEAGVHRTRGGYVTNGRPQLVQISADGCAAVRIDVRS
jgi:hypothetical protein